MFNDINYSIVIPHFNDFEGLNNLIRSIPDNDKIQIIIVDDNSDDFSLDKISPSENCKVYFNRSGNKGAGACRNIGLEKATGKWIIFADADDLFVDNSFSIFDRYLEDDSDIIYFKVSSTLKNTKKTTDRHININRLVDKLVDEKCLDICFLGSVPWGKMIRHDFLAKHHTLFDEVLVANDVMFSLKTGALAEKVKGVGECVYNVTRSSSSLTATKTNNNLALRLAVALEYNKYLQSIQKKRYQISLVSLVLRYRTVLNKGQFFQLVHRCLFGKQKLIPNDIYGNNFVKKLSSVISNHHT